MQRRYHLFLHLHAIKTRTLLYFLNRITFDAKQLLVCFFSSVRTKLQIRFNFSIPCRVIRNHVKVFFLPTFSSCALFVFAQ